jgi:hypothetical protein
MYVNPAYRIDRAARPAFAAAPGFGLVIACDADRPVAWSRPFCLEGHDEETPNCCFTWRASIRSASARHAAASG